MSDLSLDDIFAADDRQTTPVEVPEWGGAVQVRSISGKLRWKFEAAGLKGKETGDYTDFAEVSLDIVCEALGVGQRDRDKLARKSAGPLNRVRDAALKASGMDDQAVEEAAEGFGDAPTSSSDTGSPAISD